MIVYNLIILPIEYLIESVYSICYGITEEIIPSILGVSIIVGFLTLPMYNRADAIQQEERDKQKSMEKWVNHIKKHFRKDERFLMLQTYYREEGYKPLYTLKGVLPVLLQIPFFIAAYHYLSNLKSLDGAGFLIINNLGKPDNLINIGGFKLNVLPVIMTVINIISASIYSKELRWKEKWQIYLLPFIFLVLLYNSPAGLVVYWTFNNIFSLIKNIIIKKVKKEKVVIIGKALAAVIGAVVFYLLMMDTVNTGNNPKFIKSISSALAIIIYAAPLAYHMAVKENKAKSLAFIFESENKQKASPGIIVEELLLTVIYGIFIPLSVIALSPQEFGTDFSYKLFENVIYAFVFYSGVFLVWVNIIYLFSKNKEFVRKILFCLICFSVINNFFFTNGLGIISTYLRYEAIPGFSFILLIVNIIILVLVVFTVFIVSKKWKKFITSASLALLIGFVAISSYDLTVINKKLSGTYIEKNDDTYVFHLSKNGQNVIVIMLDRSMGAYIPFIMNEKPELLTSFDGFTFYPNTISLGGFTNFGSPELFGGYEYTPKAINERADEKLVDKHNEALKVMPKIFMDNGFDVTLCDLPYANYNWISDMSIFDEYPDMHTYVLEQNAVSDVVDEKDLEKIERHNFIGYSIFKTSPIFAKRLIYDSGNYMSIQRSYYVSDAFSRSYAVLDNLPDMSIAVDDGNYFIEMNNNATHEPCELQLPDYVFKENINNSEYTYPASVTVDGVTMEFNDVDDIVHYMTNMGVFIKLAEWLDFMKEQGVYDNTRIIITADHGRKLGQFENMIVNDELDVQAFNCVMLYKDFGDAGWKVSDEFMTNADTPTLAMEEIIDNPINPFTGNPINSDKKYDTLYITLSENWQVSDSNVFDTSDAPWYTVTDNIFDKSQWKKIEE